MLTVLMPVSAAAPFSVVAVLQSTTSFKLRATEYIYGSTQSDSRAEITNVWYRMDPAIALDRRSAQWEMSSVLATLNLFIFSG